MKVVLSELVLPPSAGDTDKRQKKDSNSNTAESETLSCEAELTCRVFVNGILFPPHMHVDFFKRFCAAVRSCVRRGA